jgi:hypothetical protein
MRSKSPPRAAWLSRELRSGRRSGEGNDAMCVSGTLGGVCRRRPAGPEPVSQVGG